MTYALEKFEAATFNSFGGDAFTRKLIKVTQNVAKYPPHQLDLRIQLGRRTASSTIRMVGDFHLFYSSVYFF